MRAGERGLGRPADGPTPGAVAGRHRRGRCARGAGCGRRADRGHRRPELLGVRTRRQVGQALDQPDLRPLLRPGGRYRGELLLRLGQPDLVRSRREHPLDAAPAHRRRARQLLLPAGDRPRRSDLHRRAGRLRLGDGPRRETSLARLGRQRHRPRCVRDRRRLRRQLDPEPAARAELSHHRPPRRAHHLRSAQGRRQAVVRGPRHRRTGDRDRELRA